MERSGSVYSYDGSFAGFLSVVFEAHRRGEVPARIETEGTAPQGGLFGDAVLVETDAGQAERVTRGLERRIRAEGVERLYHAFLSEADGIEHDLFRLIRRVIEDGASALNDLRFPPALRAVRMSGRVRSEVHRMHAFVRFEARASGHYVATVRPDHNVLSLIGPHFEARYPALRWAIVDAGRGYALLHTPAAERAEGAPAARFASAEALAALPEGTDEADYQAMWQTYFRAVTIPERRNLKLHLRHVPRRYWPYLTEKRAA